MYVKERKNRQAEGRAPALLELNLIRRKRRLAVEVIMRDIIFGGANSLDNYLARPDHAVDWLMWGEEAAAVTAGIWKTIDTVLMGRKTYEVAARMGQARGYPGVKNYVFSSTITAPPDSEVVVVREDAVGFVRDLKVQEGKSICLIGGGELAKTLFEADLIDVIGFNVHPVLLGAGIPLFHPMSRQIDLELHECRAFKNGCVYVLYRVRRDIAASQDSP